MFQNICISRILNVHRIEIHYMYIRVIIKLNDEIRFLHLNAENIF